MGARLTALLLGAEVDVGPAVPEPDEPHGEVQGLGHGAQVGEYLAGTRPALRVDGYGDAVHHQDKRPVLCNPRVIVPLAASWAVAVGGVQHDGDGAVVVEGHVHVCLEAPGLDPQPCVTEQLQGPGEEGLGIGR